MLVCHVLSTNGLAFADADSQLTGFVRKAPQIMWHCHI